MQICRHMFVVNYRLLLVLDDGMIWDDKHMSNTSDEIISYISKSDNESSVYKLELTVPLHVTL